VEEGQREDCQKGLEDQKDGTKNCAPSPTEGSGAPKCASRAPNASNTGLPQSTMCHITSQVDWRSLNAVACTAPQRKKRKICESGETRREGIHDPTGGSGSEYLRA
jgi:hypothetical protein